MPSPPYNFAVVAEPSNKTTGLAISRRAEITADDAYRRYKMKDSPPPASIKKTNVPNPEAWQQWVRDIDRAIAQKSNCLRYSKGIYVHGAQPSQKPT